MPVLPPPRLLPPAVARKVAVARAGVTWETLWPRFVPLLGLVALFLAAAHLDLFAFLSPWVHTGVLAGLVVLVGLVVWYLFRGYRLPATDAGQRRLESDNGVVHRPLQAIDDQLAAGQADPASRALWDLHRKREAERLAGLKNKLPHPGMAALDRMAVRVLPVLALVVSVVVAGGWRNDRVEAALVPAFPPPPPVTAELWISPPGYTRRAPVYLDMQDPSRLVRVPVGSKLAGFVEDTRGRRPPVLQIDGQELTFNKVGEGKYQIETALQGGSNITLRARGDEQATWRLHVTPDLPPTVDFARDVSVERWSTRIDWLAADDFGVAAAQLQIRLHGSALAEDMVIDDEEEPEILRVDLAVPGSNATRIEETFRQDLTAHPWAGLKATLRLVAVDAAGQEGKSRGLTFLLPERVFKEAAARTVILLRKALSRDPKGNREPVAQALLQVNGQPDSYRHDSVVYLGLRVAANRLLHEQSKQSVAEVQKLLWDVALRIEGGALSDAERAVEQAERELREAIQREAGDEEIERLIQQLYEAMARMQRELAERMKDPAERERMRQQRQQAQRSMNSNDLQKMLDRIREMAKNGQREEAKRLLEELRKMLENAQPMMAEGDEGEEGQEGQQGQQRQGMQGQQGRDMMNQLDRMARRQNQLLGESEREMRGQQQGQQRGQQGQQGQQRGQQQGRQQGQQGQQGEQGQQGQQGQQQGQGQPGEQGGQPGQQGQPGQGGVGDQLGNQQGTLRRQLNDMRNRLNDMGGRQPDALGRSEEAMRDAEEALRNKDFRGAARAQRRALDNLQQGMGDVAEQMRQGGPGTAQDRGEPEDGRQEAMDRDPLGRSEGNYGNAVDNGSNKVPTEPEMQRSREIMDELRRRAGETDRPSQELDYIDRLLRRF